MLVNMIKSFKWPGIIGLIVLFFIAILAVGCQGPTGPLGPAGAAGPPGPAGPPAPPPTTPAPAPPVVAVDAGQDVISKPGAAVTLKAAAKINNSSTVTGYKWTQVSGVTASIAGADTQSATVTLSNAAAYKTALISGLKTLDRFMVQAINPHALGGAEIATFKVTVTTSSGSYTDTVNVNADLPYIVNTGLANVAQGEPVLLQSKNQASYTWSITGPTGSKATLTDASTQKIGRAHV